MKEATKERDALGPTAADSMAFHLSARRTQLLMTLISQREIRENRLETIGQKADSMRLGRGYGPLFCPLLVRCGTEDPFWMLRRCRDQATTLTYQKLGF